MTDPLRVQLSVVTTDPEIAHDRLRQSYAGADMRVPRDGPAFEYRQDVEGDSELSRGRFHFGGHGRVRLELEDRVTVVRPRTGTHDWEIDGRRGTGLMLIQPHEEYRAVLGHLTVDTVDFSLSALRRTARTVYGQDLPGIAFEHPHPAAPATGSYWEATHEFVHGAMRDPAVAAAPLLAADLVRRLAVATLEGFARSGGPEAVRRVSTATQGTAYRRSVEFMHAALAQPITVEDVARHVGLSTVELTRAFRAHRGTTPAAYLRELRLEAAHEDLLRADRAAGATVRAVALRWGFPAPGHFARRYRQAYGRSPGQVLRG